jgi:predicted HTH domain antitoxin
MDLFGELTKVSADEAAWNDKTVQKVGDTTLDRVHHAMILFAAGRGEALKRFLVEDGAGRDQRFWRLAQALSGLYPASTSDKRWVDGALARKKGLGLRDQGQTYSIHGELTMTQVVLEFEPSACSVLRRGPEEFAQEVQTAAVVQWYAEGRISHSKASEILGISRAAFLDELFRRKVLAIQVTPEALEREIHGEF